MKKFIIALPVFILTIIIATNSYARPFKTKKDNPVSFGPSFISCPAYSAIGATMAGKHLKIGFYKTSYQSVIPGLKYQQDYNASTLLGIYSPQFSIKTNIKSTAGIGIIQRYIKGEDNEIDKYIEIETQLNNNLSIATSIIFSQTEYSTNQGKIGFGFSISYMM